MAISVRNNTVANIQAAISIWAEKHGDTSTFTIRAGATETWGGRDDPRGFILALTQNGGMKTYLVMENDNIIVNDDNVMNNNHTIHPLHHE